MASSCNNTTTSESRGSGGVVFADTVTPIFCALQPTSRSETLVDNHHHDDSLRLNHQPVRSSRRRSRRQDPKRRTHLRRQSSSPGPSPRLSNASHFANDAFPPSRSESTSSTTEDENKIEDDMAATTIDFDEMAERLRREEEESVALARMLMAEEAMESYARSADFLRQNAQYYSPEDLEALQAVLQEDGEEESDTTEEDLSYDTMVRLGETIGDVKSERWALIAREEINKLEEFSHRPDDKSSSKASESKDDSTVKCLVCQFAYEQNERLRRLPCGHCFHSTCVGSWLMNKDSCPYCRQPVIPNHDY